MSGCKIEDQPAAISTRSENILPTKDHYSWRDVEGSFRQSCLFVCLYVCMSVKMKLRRCICETGNLPRLVHSATNKRDPPRFRQSAGSRIILCQIPETPGMQKITIPGIHRRSKTHRIQIEVDKNDHIGPTEGLHTRKKAGVERP